MDYARFVFWLLMLLILIGITVPIFRREGGQNWMTSGLGFAWWLAVATLGFVVLKPGWVS